MKIHEEGSYQYGHLDNTRVK